MEAPGIVLLIENNQKAMKVNRESLEEKGFFVCCANTLREARRYLSASKPDVLVLDNTLPDGSGLDFCREIRKQTVASILFFAAAGAELEIMEAFAAGANDYIPTPYPTEEFAAWVAAHIHLIQMVRKQGERIRFITRGSLTLDVMTATATLNEVDLFLALKEFALLLLLVQGDGEYIDKESLYFQIWKRNANSDYGALKTAIYRLRKKIEGSEYRIHSKRGKGYRFSLLCSDNHLS